jgi:hypothetical protein
MRRLLVVGAGFAGLVALFTVWRTQREVSEGMSAEGIAPAPLPARVVDSTARPPAPPERTRGATTPGPAPRDPSDTNEARLTALHQAIATTTTEAARLYSDFARAGVATPPQARTLVQLQQGGTSHDDLVEYVRTSFPNDVIARAVALRWLDPGSVVRPSLDTNAPRALGGVVKRVAN